MSTINSPQDFAQIAAIDFIYDEKIIVFRVIAGLPAKFQKNPVLEIKTTVSVGPVSLDKILVGI